MVKIAIHSVFIAKENILFLEEWIDYHIQLGVDEFFLYDNSKVEKIVGFDAPKKFMIPGKINRNKVNFDKLVNLSDTDIAIILKQIQAKYNNVNIIEWSPKDMDGKICHFQEKAHNDCLAKLKQTDIDWCISIDMDEYIVLKDITLKDFIINLDPMAYCCMLSQKRFDSRFNNFGIPVVTINKTLQTQLDMSHSNKYIYNVKKTSSVSIHSCKGNGKLIHTRLNGIWFNHYNTDFNNPDNKYNTIENNMDPVIVKNIVNNYKDFIVNSIDKDIQLWGPQSSNDEGRGI